MRILFFGDIVGSLGLKAVADALPGLRKSLAIDFVIANGENAAKGKGIFLSDYESLMDAGVDVVTLGNHYRSKAQIDRFIDHCPFLLRPLNVAGYSRGQGTGVFECNGVKIRVTNLLGTAFMTELVHDPYETMEDLLKNASPCDIHIVDYHAESTSEKQIFGYGVDGRVSAVLGTHTHCMTADEHILPNGTAYQTDVGFCGGYETVIGTTKESAMEKFLRGNEEIHLVVPEEGPTQINATLLDVDPSTGRATSIRRIFLIDGKEKIS